MLKKELISKNLFAAFDGEHLVLQSATEGLCDVALRLDWEAALGLSKFIKQIVNELEEGTPQP